MCNEFLTEKIAIEKAGNKPWIKQILIQFSFKITIKVDFTAMKMHWLTTWLQKASLQSLTVLHHAIYDDLKG